MTQSTWAATLGIGSMMLRLRPTACWVRKTLVSSLVLSFAAACASPGTPKPAGADTQAGHEPTDQAGPSYHLGGGAALRAANDSGARFEDVYGSVLPSFVFDLETRFSNGWFLNATGEYGSTSGREMLVTGDESETKLSLFPAHMTVGKLFDLKPEWQLAAGGGATISTYREVNDIVESDGTRAGGHGLLGVRWHRNRWSLNGTLRYTYVPDGLEERQGGQEVVERHDLGYLSLAFTAQYQIWPRATGASQAGEAGQAGHSGSAAGWMADRGRFQVQLYGAGVFPTENYRRPSTRVRDLLASVDSTLGIGAGFRARLTGPLGVGFDAIFAWPEIHGTLVYPYAGNSFNADGELEQKMFAFGFDFHLLERPAVDLYITPLVSYLSYNGRLTGEYTSTVDSDGYSFGLGAGTEIGRGRWVFHISFKHLSLARISGFETGFNVRPVLLTFGLGFRF